MADTWTLRFVDNTSFEDENLSSEIPDAINSGASKKPTKKAGKTDKKTFSNEFTQKIKDDAIQNAIISPLNTVTGGLASPIYQTSKQIITGASIGGALGTLGATVLMVGIQKGIEALQNRMTEIEQKVISLNNADNVLIRAGAVSKATYYTGNVFGVKSRTDRS